MLTTETMTNVNAERDVLLQKKIAAEPAALYPPIAVPMIRRAIELRKTRPGDDGVFSGLWLDGYRPMTLRGRRKDDPVPLMCWECGQALTGRKIRFCSQECATAFSSAICQTIDVGGGSHTKLLASLLTIPGRRPVTEWTKMLTGVRS